jgi:hypothetical protein
MSRKSHELPTSRWPPHLVSAPKSSSLCFPSRLTRSPLFGTSRYSRRNGLVMRSTKQQGTSGFLGVRDRPADKMTVFGDRVFRLSLLLWTALGRDDGGNMIGWDRRTVQVRLRHHTFSSSLSPAPSYGPGRTLMDSQHTTKRERNGYSGPGTSWLVIPI